VRWDDDLTFTATRRELLEGSLVTVPADGSASIRSLGAGHHDDIDTIRNRMQARRRMQIRQAMHDCKSAWGPDADLHTNVLITWR
jgi:hypothetical protein